MPRLSLRWPTAERCSVRASCTLPALWFLPVSSCLLPVGLCDHPHAPGIAGLGTTALFLPDLGVGLSRGHSESPELALTMPSSPGPLSSHGCREDWLMSSSCLRPGGLSRAENTIRVSTPANVPSLPPSQADTRWLLARLSHTQRGL